VNSPAFGPPPCDRRNSKQAKPVKTARTPLDDEQQSVTRQRKDYSAHLRKHPSRPVRIALVLVGTGAVCAGLVGMFLPVLPTTPFLLVAAACYARASRRFYNTLLNNRMFGPTILEWQQYRSIHFRTKIIAIAMMAATLAVSIVFFVVDVRLQVLLALFGLMLAVYLYRIPSRDRPG
jgi:uncharacterized protein